MIRLSCLNVHKQGTSSVAALADYLQGDSSQVLALSEVDVPETAGVG